MLGKLSAALLEAVGQRVVEAARATYARPGAVTLLARVTDGAAGPALPYVVPLGVQRAGSDRPRGRWGGTQLSISMKLFQHNEVLTLALAILLLVTLVDVVGGSARAHILEAPTIRACAPSPRGG